MPDVIILPEGGTNDEQNETRIEVLETWSDETVDYLGRLRGRSYLSLYDDFTTQANGAIAGREIEIGDFEWLTTGSVLPTVTSGKVSSNGSGYLYTTDPELPFLIGCDVSFGGTTGSAPATLSFSRDADNILDHLIHLNFSETGYTLTIRQDGGSFLTVLEGVWTAPLALDGTIYHFALSVVGEVAAVYGASGEVVAARDPRIASVMAGYDGSLFWQAMTHDPTDAYLHRVWAMSREDDGYIGASDYIESLAGGGLNIGNRGRVIGSRFGAGEVLVGSDPASGYPAIRFGPEEIRTTLQADVDATDTTMTTDQPLPSGSTVVVGFGDNEESRTTDAFSVGASSPFTTTVTVAFGNAHSAGDPVIATVSSTFRKTIIINLGNGLLYMPNNLWIAGDGRFYLGDSLDVSFRRIAANVMGLDDGDSFDLQGTHDGGNLRLRDSYLWVDATGDLRIKSSAPSSDLDGTVVGTQS